MSTIVDISTQLERGPPKIGRTCVLHSFQPPKSYLMANWFITLAGTEMGPLNDDQLRALVTSGKLSGDDLVRKEGAGNAVEAKQIRGLFPAIVQPPSPTQPPAPPTQSPGAPASPPIRGMFAEWYGGTVGKWFIPLQMLAWLFSGYFWIPAWWGFSLLNSTNPRLVTKGRWVMAALVCGFLVCMASVSKQRGELRRKSYESSVTRQSAAAPTPAGENFLEDFSETPLPVHDAIAHRDKTVWKLDGGGVGAKGETYAIFNTDGTLDEIIFKNLWSGVEVKAYFPQRSESKVITWTRAELASSGDSKLFWTLESYSDEGFTIVGTLHTSAPIANSTTKITIKAAVDLDQGRGKWEQVETLDIDYKNKAFKRDIEPKRTNGNARLLTYRADGFYN